jgi:hypothetical protein
MQFWVLWRDARARSQGPPLNLNGNVLAADATPPTMLAPCTGRDARAPCAPAQRRARARTEQLFNAAANDDVLRWDTADGHLHLILPHKPPAYSAKEVTAGIANAVRAADDQNSVRQGIYKARTQKLFIVPQANVLSGAGQVHRTAAGGEDVAAEKQAEVQGAKRIMSAAKKAALEKKKDAARAAKGANTARPAKGQKLDAAPYMRPMPAPFGKEAAPLQVGHPRPFSVPGGVRPMGAKQVAGNQEYGQSGMTLAEVSGRETERARERGGTRTGEKGVRGQRPRIQKTACAVSVFACDRRCRWCEL